MSSIVNFDVSSIDVAIPIKEHSSRIEGKNIKVFEHGLTLLHIKLFQTLNIFKPSQITVFTDSQVALQIAKNENVNSQFISDFSNHSWPKNIDMMVQRLKREYFCINRVTTPFIGSMELISFLETFFHSLSNFDSAVSVLQIQSQIFDEEQKPMNFGIGYAHVNSQDTKPIFMEVCGVSIIKREKAMQLHYHYGTKPLLYILDPLRGFDINVKKDWELAHLFAELQTLKEILCLSQLKVKS